MLDKNYENTNGRPQHTNQADNKKTNHSYKGWSNILEKIDYSSVSEKPKALPAVRRALQHPSVSKVLFA